jgi:putative ABC transport system permease protein
MTGSLPTFPGWSPSNPVDMGDDFLQDFRYAARTLRRAPGFAAIAVVTLALGIGANTAMFSVLNTYLFRPLPYPEPERLVQVLRTSIHSDSWPHSAANFVDFRQRNDVFAEMVAFNGMSPVLLRDGLPAERLQGLSVSGNFFAALGVPPALGRVFSDEEDQPNANRVVVLSDRTWRTRFGAHANIVGRTLRLDEDEVQVIGVMPAAFEHPLLWGSVDMWRPIAFTAEQRKNRGNNYLRAFARLKPGVEIGAAQQAMTTLAANLGRETSSNDNESLRLAPLPRSSSSDVTRNVMWFTFGLAGVVLLITCANLANLQLVRGTARVREHSVRAALGARRARLLRGSLTESMLLAGLGGGLSLLLAYGAIEVINRSLFTFLPGAAVTVDFRVFGFALLVSVATGIAFGTVPAWLASRTDVNHALKESPRGSTSAAHHRLRHALIVGEVAFAVILLTGAGLFLRGLQRFGELDYGWRPDGLLTGQLGLQGSRYATPDQRRGFYQQLEERLRSIPGVRNVALSTSMPVWGFNSSGGVFIEGQPDPEPGKFPEVFFEQVSRGYFDTLGFRLISGRTFEPTDVAGNTEVVVINDTMARRFWPNQNPLGKRIARPNPKRIWLEVVGVVSDVGFPANLSEPYTALQAFRPLAQAAVPFVNVTVRSAAAPEDLTQPMRQAVAELDPALALHRLRSARSLVDEGLSNVSLLGTLLGAFAALGLALAAIGIYGVTSYSVVQRMNELGIRMALGAGTRDVLWLILSTGAGVIALGALIGSAGAVAVTRLLAATIPTLPTRDPAALAGLILFLVAIALVACFVPAGRAARVDPLVALRHQ